MPLASARRSGLALATMAVVIAVGSACDRGPQITCLDVASADCSRALDIARPLLRSYWEQASEVQVHPGGCSWYRHCLLTLAHDQGFITVDLVSDRPEMAFVVINRHNANWTASCALTVPDASGAHGESCAEK